VVERIDPFVTILSGDPETGPGGDEGAACLSEVSEKSRRPSTSPIQVEIQKAAGEISARLRIAEGTEVISRHQRRYLDGTPWSLQTSFYPMEFSRRGAERLMRFGDIAEGTTRYLARTLGLRQVGYCDMITVRRPEMAEAQFFMLPPDGQVAVYEIFRTAFDQNGAPMRLTVTVLPTDRNQFIINIGSVPMPLMSAGLERRSSSGPSFFV
jgi:GntR family transcriptional regulator